MWILRQGGVFGVGRLSRNQKTISLWGERGGEAGIGERSVAEARIGRIYALTGKKREAQKVLDKLKELSKQGYVPPYNMALIYDGLGEKEQAITWLEKAFAEGRSHMGLKVDPTWDNLRSEPRFQDLLGRIGFPK